MKRWIRFGAAVLIALTLCVVFGKILTTYYQPMENAVYDLSLGWETEAMPDDWVYDQKGWTVFTQEGETRTELTPDGLSGFYGMVEAGQTFYFSRVLVEDLDNPTLRLDPADRTFSVFLDETLVYTDCPELDNRIGYLQLPHQDWYRTEPLLIKLPLDYAGKTLTIAQSTSPYFEEGFEYERVYPADSELYCGYAYESALIAESFQTAIPSTLSYAAGIVLLAIFLLQAFHGRLDAGILCGALAAFAYLTSSIILPSFYSMYLIPSPIDVYELCRYLIPLILLIMLLCKLSGWRRRVLLIVTAALCGIEAVYFAMTMQVNTSISLHLWYPFLAAAGLFLAMLLGVGEWNRQPWFFRVFCPLALGGMLLYVLPTAATTAPNVWSIAIFFWPTTVVSLLAALLASIVEWGHDELTRRTEARLLAQRSELAQNSYEAMRRQHEQVMMLRHDMTKHFQLLRQTSSDEKTVKYLDELIGENEKIRPVIQSGNEILDIILNGKLSAASDAGITVELARTQAPDKLPLSDAELCSLMMNIMDNALEAASAPEVEHPYIKLDLCVKKHFFIIFCENSTTLKHIQRKTASEHGFGLKIIKQIAARYGNLLETKYGTDHYIVKLAIPLD